MNEKTCSLSIYLSNQRYIPIKRLENIFNVDHESISSSMSWEGRCRCILDLEEADVNALSGRQRIIKRGLTINLTRLCRRDARISGRWDSSCQDTTGRWALWVPPDPAQPAWLRLCSCSADQAVLTADYLTSALLQKQAAIYKCPAHTRTTKRECYT